MADKEVPQFKDRSNYAGWFNSLTVDEQMLVTLDEFKQAVYGYASGDYIPFECLEVALHCMEDFLGLE